MKISSEWDLLRKIREMVDSQGAPYPDDLITGIGDDCAAFRIDDTRYGLITTDIAIEGKHFSRDYASMKEIGAKAMTANISDIAAMAGRPRFAFISLGIPDYIQEEDSESLYSGMLDICSHDGIIIAGGDISAADSLVLNIALYGEVDKKQMVPRNGAFSGQVIYSTGTTGASRAGLEILRSGKNRRKFPTCVKRHLIPQHRLALVEGIARRFSPTAMIDISDGLTSDLGHIAVASGVGFELYADAFPLHTELVQYCGSIGSDPLDYVLSSGEEYELLFTASYTESGPLDEIGGIGVCPIGRVIDSGFFIVRNGVREKVDLRGYDHFRV